MRQTLLCLLAGALLTSCINDGGSNRQSKPLTAQALSTSQVYRPNTGLTTTNWWHKFNNHQLNQLIAIALANAPSMQTAEARVRKAEQISKEAATLSWPTVDLSGYAQRQRFAKFGLVPPPFNGRTYNIATLGLNLNYDFDLWGKNRQIWMASLGEQYASLADLAEARLVLSAAVASTYFKLQGEREQIRLAKTNWHISEELAQIAHTRQQHGIESAIPVTTLRANAEAAKQALKQFQQAAALAQHQLAMLLGNNAISTHIITQPFSFHDVRVRLPASLPANLLANRPDIDAAKQRTAAAASRAKVAKARFFPNINLSGLFSYQAAGNGLSHFLSAESQNNAITGAIDLPIFDAGARRANLGVKYAEYDIAVNAYNQTILTALQEVADQLAILNTLHSQLTSENVAVSTLSHQFKLMRTRYQHGIIDYATLIQNQQQLLRQQALQKDLQTRHLQAVVAMLKALGGSDMLRKDSQS